MQIKGGEELLRKLRQLGVNVEDVLEVATLAGAQVIANAANPLAPEPLIEAQVTEKRKKSVTVDIGPPEKKWYWRFLETGATGHEITGHPLVFEGDEGLVVTGGVRHPGMAARPFLRPALDTKKSAAVGAVGDEIRRVAK